MNEDIKKSEILEEDLEKVSGGNDITFGEYKPFSDGFGEGFVPVDPVFQPENP